MNVHYARGANGLLTVPRLAAPSEDRQARMEHNTAPEKKEAGLTVLASARSLAGGAVCLVQLNYHAAEEQAPWLRHH